MKYFTFLNRGERARFFRLHLFSLFLNCGSNFRCSKNPALSEVNRGQTRLSEAKKIGAHNTIFSNPPLAPAVVLACPMHFM